MKTIIHFIGWAAIASTTSAQGVLGVRSFTGTFSGSIDVPFYDQNGALLEGDDHAVQLYAGLFPEALEPVGAIGGFEGGRKPGAFKGFTVAIPFVPFHQYAWAQVRVWDVAGGANFEEAALSGFWTGVSNLIHVRTAGEGGGVPELPGDLIGLAYPGVPVIVEQPRDFAVQLGRHATLSVIASTTIQPTFQWFDTDTGRPVKGATNTVFTTPDLPASGHYRVRIGNPAGFTDSRVATVLVSSTTAASLAIHWQDDMPVIRVTGNPEVSYRLEYSDHPTTQDWTPLADLVLHGTAVDFLDQSAAQAPVRFYRLGLP